MDNLPLMIYWIEVLTSLMTALGVVSMVVGLACAGLMGAALIYCDMAYGKDEKTRAEDFLKKVISFSKKAYTAIFILIVLSVFVPPKQMIYTIIGIDIGIKALNSEQGQELTGEMGEVFTKSLQLLNQKIDEQLGEQNE